RGGKQYHVYPRIDYLLVGIKSDKFIFLFYFDLIVRNLHQGCMGLFQAIFKSIAHSVQDYVRICFQGLCGGTCPTPATTDQSNLERGIPIGFGGTKGNCRIGQRASDNGYAGFFYKFPATRWERFLIHIFHWYL